MSSIRPLLRAASTIPRTTPIRTFHASARSLVQVGDAIPSVELFENSPGNKVNIANELKGRSIIVGVPAAFSPACSESHIPGYISSKDLKGVDSVFVVSVNDPFVMKAWAASLDPSQKSGIRFLADPHLDFTKALDLAFDGTSIFGGHRSKRYALVVEDGKVKEAHVEPDNTGLNVSAAAKVLKAKW
ncbi:thioredoxin peroxidase/alkyl hydroperoxide reductase [Eremomyces bilateralis CBS 781.70]|uniref:Thioredoxin peroxidase/alkyl hydroperoxide reductase n=1 Tax=Eremomyces bilateralis CBS 781.70 TaxID=1392243 RepID=A0A6G1FUP7_9PEZI|nr:thioredoxin peroxidase/alkyl hydroperoxide reductase [Eremomyces bilateralis CBS 781.70]KAF1809412.1 thioredoxin peroxidase/alkyl hydroperoxide reductase [Eremomyces bilateralis CBS 781.70]